MTISSIDEQNNITAFSSHAEATAASATPFDSFNNQQELADLLAGWPTARLTATWNSLPGVTPVKRFKSHQAAAARIWTRIQSLAEAQPDGASAGPAGPESPASAPSPRRAAHKSTTAKPARKGRKAAPQPAEPRKGTKTARVVALLQRKNGATLSEIMQKMGWQKHTVRGFMAGALKKAGYRVLSFKSESGERTYRINP